MLIALWFIRKILRIALPQEDDPFVLYMVFRGAEDSNVYVLPVAKSPYRNAVFSVREDYKKLGWSGFITSASRLSVDAKAKVKNHTNHTPIFIDWNVILKNPSQYLYTSNLAKLYGMRTKQYTNVTML
jgi:hypothetical protein